MFYYILLTVHLVSGVVEGPVPATQGRKLLQYPSLEVCLEEATRLGEFVWGLEVKEHGEGSVERVEAECFLHEKPKEGHDI